MRQPAFWVEGGWRAYGLLPLAALFCGLAALRHAYYRYRPPQPLAAPVIVVGNLTVGGSGKTPLVAALAAHLRQQGRRVGIISRGYGGRARRYPLVVEATTDPVQAGDEPVMLAQLTGCPVVVDPDRRRAAQTLAAQYPCDLLLSDDGLQHYPLPRCLEIAVLPETRCGNGHCLPAGPLREPVRRLQTVDMVVARGQPQPGEWAMRLIADEVWLLANPDRRQPLSAWRGRTVCAVAGIARPEQFFNLLRTAGLTVVEYPFPDHHVYRADELRCPAGLPIFMTAKDAVKWQRFGLAGAWVVPVTAVLAADFWRWFDARLREKCSG